MASLILAVHVLVAITLVGLILLQQGKGAALGAAMGSGASNTMFGSIGATPFLVKLTAGLATLFFVTSLSLGYLAAHQARTHKTLLQQLTQQVPKKKAPPVATTPPKSKDAITSPVKQPTKKTKAR